MKRTVAILALSWLIAVSAQAAPPATGGRLSAAKSDLLKAGPGAAKPTKLKLAGADMRWPGAALAKGSVAERSLFDDAGGGASAGAKSAAAATPQLKPNLVKTKAAVALEGEARNKMKALPPTAAGISDKLKDFSIK